MNNPQTYFFALAAVVVVAVVFGQIARLLRQPPVIGEIIAGILLGPTLFGGALSNLVLPVTVRPFLTGLANLGLAVFMCVVGMEIDLRLLRGTGRVVVAAAAGATLVPLGCGAALAMVLTHWRDVPDPTAFVMFMGVAIAATAFPVLARILDDRGLGPTLLGTISLSTAAVCDLVAWTALAAVEIVATAGSPLVHWRLLLLMPYGAIMLRVVRPLLRRLLPDRQLTPAGFAIAVAGLFLSAGMTQLIGLHLVFGGFLFGLIMPEHPTARADLLRGCRFATVLLLPIYFVTAGLQVNLANLNAVDLAELALIVVVAIVSKFGGTMLGARSVGLSWQQSAALGNLMNTRGLTELVILTVGLQIGVLDTRLYSLMVMMALVTTAMTGPLLSRLKLTSQPEAAPPPATAIAPEPGAGLGQSGLRTDR